MTQTGKLSTGKKLGVVLLQLGGPDSLEAVQPFLEQMFRDPDLLNLRIPGWIQGWLARKFAVRRTVHVRQLYASIGGKSTIGEITHLQANLLAKRLRHSIDCKVFVAMRYGNHSSKEAIESILEAGCEQLILLPLYPQYCSASTGSSLNEWYRCCRAMGLDLLTVQIDSYCSAKMYICALVQRIHETLNKFPADISPHLVFSAHGIPSSLITKGDPYQKQIEQTTQLVVRECPKSLPHTLCYQSKATPVAWLEPSLTKTLKNLGKSGTQAVLVIPISFVSDHLETLSEINIEARRDAESWGIRHFQMMPGLNDSPLFIDALAELVLQVIVQQQSL